MDMSGMDDIFSTSSDGDTQGTNDALHKAFYLLVMFVSFFVLKLAIKELVNDLTYVIDLVLPHLSTAVSTKIPKKLSFAGRKTPTGHDGIPKLANRKCPDEAETLTHFAKAFSRPDHLIKGMARHNFLLSGSRALDLFVPGSATDDSDWDFYVYNNHDCIAGTLTTLADCGVVWDDVFMPLRRLLAAPEGEIMNISRKTAQAYYDHLRLVHQLRHNGHLVLVDNTLDSLLRSIPTAIRTLDDQFDRIHMSASEGEEEQALRMPVKVFIQANKAELCIHRTCRMDDTETDPDYGPKVNVIRGHTTWNGIRHNVQLISRPGASPIDLIMAYYASHVQCFVSAFGAAHLYGEAASNRKAFWWPDNTQDRASAEAAKIKYESRGFTFTERSSAAHLRELRSLEEYPGAKLAMFNFEFQFGIPRALEALRRQALQKLAWIEKSDRTWRVADAEVALNQEQLALRFSNSTDPEDKYPHLLGKYDDIYDKCVIFPTDDRVPERLTLF